jgi:hypothetical protein
MEDLGKLLVLRVGHFVAVCLGVAAGFVWIRGIAIKEGLGGVVAQNDFACRSVLDLDALESLNNFRKSLDAAKPP